MESEKRNQNNHHHSQRNVTEQLRSNHIDTLEVLQSTQDENEKLKNSLKQLQEKVDSMNTIYNTSDSNHTSAPSAAENEMITLLQKNRDLVEQVSNLQIQIKQYQLQEQKRLLQQQKAGGTSIEELSNIIQKMKQKEYHDNNKLKELEKNLEYHSMMTEQLKQEYENKLLEQKQNFMLFQNQLFNFQSQYNEMKNDLQLKNQDYHDLQQIKDNLEKQLSLQGQQLITRYDRDMKLKDDEIQQLKFQIDQYEHLLQEKDDLVLQFQQELQRYNSTISELQDPHGLRTNLPTLLHFTDSDCESVEVIPPIQAATSPKQPATSPKNPGADSITPRFSPIPHTGIEKKDDDDPVADVTEPAVNGRNAFSPIHGNIRFQEFMDLKLENRELKMRLAELTGHTDYHAYANLSPNGNGNGNVNHHNQGVRSSMLVNALASSSGNVGKSTKGVTSNTNLNVTIPAIVLTRSNSGVGTPIAGVNTGGGKSRRSFDSGVMTNGSNGFVPTLNKSNTNLTFSGSTSSGKDLVMSQSATTLRSSTIIHRPPSNSLKFPKVAK